jgi:hypothetical protein
MTQGPRKHHTSGLSINAEIKHQLRMESTPQSNGPSPERQQRGNGCR